jgi:hypothetical protein
LVSNIPDPYKAHAEERGGIFCTQRESGLEGRKKENMKEFIITSKTPDYVTVF